MLFCVIDYSLKLLKKEIIRYSKTDPFLLYILTKLILLYKFCSSNILISVFISHYSVSVY